MNLEKYPNDFLSVKDLMQIFGMSKQTIYRALKDGKFGRYEKVGRGHKIPKQYIIDRYFKDCS